MLRQMISALPQRNLKSHFLSLQAVLKNQVRRFLRDALAKCSTAQEARRRQPDSRVYMALPGVVLMVSDMSQCSQGVLKKRNRPNARQRRHRRAARSPIEEMAFCAPRRVTICVAYLLYWHPCKNDLDSQRRTQISAQCGSPEISSE